MDDYRSCDEVWINIARDLAKYDAPTEPLNGTCTLCKRSITDTQRADDHEEYCPWRRARKAY